MRLPENNYWSQNQDLQDVRIQETTSRKVLAEGKIVISSDNGLDLNVRKLRFYSS
jgi:hypothetical protein